MAEDIDEVILRSYPKIIFFYPSAILSLVIGVFLQFIPAFNPTFINQFLFDFNFETDMRIVFGLIWLTVFLGNVLINSFDYEAMKVFGLILLGICGVLIFILIKAFYPEFVGAIPTFSINDLELVMSANFYYAVGGLFVIIFFGIWLEKRWDYYKITSQDVIHRTGAFGELERMPAPNIHLYKKIPDIFEYLLLRSGDITIIPASRGGIIHLTNVLNINKKEKAIQQLLRVLEVEAD